MVERLCSVGAALALVVLVASASPSNASASEDSGASAESQGAAPATDTAELTSALTRLRIESLAAADRRAVLSRGEELFLVAPGDAVPGLPQSRIESVHAERLVVLLPDAKTVILTPGRSGDLLVEWIDGNPPPVPPLMLPVAVISEPEVTEPGVEIRTFSAAESGVATPREDGP